MAAENHDKELRKQSCCSICLEPVTDLLLLECGDSFCRPCITRSWEASNTNFPCPQCSESGSRETLKMHLETLRKQLEDLIKFKSNEEKKSEELRDEAESKRQKIESEFEELHQFLIKEKQILLSRLEEEEKKILQRIRDSVTQLDTQIFSLTQLISEIGEKIEKSPQPATELLKDVKDAMSRCPEPEAVSVDLKMGSALNYIQQLKELITKLGDRWMEWWMECIKYAVDVTIDPETAHPILELSADRKSVSRGFIDRDLPDNPERFDTNWSVLGVEGFTSGRHYWEVEVEDGWRLGVCKDSVRRKGRGQWIHPSPQEGYWVLQLWYGEYSALTSPETSLSHRKRPQVLGIFLDYEAGKVSFYNADNKVLLFTFTDIFTEKLRPFFYTYNETPLRIRPVAAWE
ncbi:E3 ubiquitin-protein ligase TRIM39 isoform X2 [Microcaecilia unicolor]|uniref:E3 ubiquitin-protein ligase TRIM39-like isoform X2 n=1 Tax=Microcaecilia unicolor TaxID=1415580 RepID=A0A6P7XJR5_9AMPH|nr:E3 ubiquitin-protein ligase TRIM39-like isoform X2 [Microcaecilia unicolor]